MIRPYACLLAAMLLLLHGIAQALPTDRTLGQLSHTRWTTDDNAPSNIQALAQTRDGFLWIGSSTGLYRFDGLVFERVDIVGPESSVTALLATRDGRLLVGLQNGHLLLLRHGLQTDVTFSSLSKNIRKIVEDRSGGIWVQSIAADMGLARYQHGRWQRFGPQQGVPEDALIITTLAAPDSAVWALTQDRLLVLKPGTNRFETVLAALDDRIEGLFVDAGGHVWLGDHRKGLWQISGPAGQAGADLRFFHPANRFHRLLVDHAGAIWGDVLSGGLFRIVPTDPARQQTARAEQFGSARGLSADSVNALLEDREGTIWVGTSGGLDRFRPSNVVLEEAIPATSPYGYGIFADHAGTIHISDSDTIYRVLAGGSPVKVLTGLNNPMALCEGTAGTIWLAVSGGVASLHNGSFKRTPPPGDSDYMGCRGDHDGRPWFLTTTGELFKLSAKGWDRQAIVPDRALTTRFTFDAQGRLLVFLENGHVRQ